MSTEVSLSNLKTDYELNYPNFKYPDANNNSTILYLDYEDETQLSKIQEMAAANLSEPYSVFTYRYFLQNWPNLCICAYNEEIINGVKTRGSMIGTILCKLERNDDENSLNESEHTSYRGYIAMLIVDTSARKRGIGLKLSMLAIERMIENGCDVIVLETEACNATALALYDKLGFVREELLPRYYDLLYTYEVICIMDYYVL